MKKKIRILFVLIVCALMAHTGLTATAVPVSAAVKTNGTIDLQKKSLIIPNGKKTAIKGNKITIVRGCKYQVKAKSTKAKLKSSKPSVLSVSKKIITAKKPGTATLRITYKNKNQSLKIRIVASHKHSFQTTKKATCETKGVETCSVCGLKNTLPKTAHHYVTDTSTSIEKRGKKTKYEISMICSGCRWDMTDWTNEQQMAHQFHINAMIEGKLSDACLNVGYTSVMGAVRYEKLVKVQSVATYCEDCGAFDMDKTYSKDLYYVNAKGEKIGANEDPYAVWSYDNYMKVHGFVPCEQCHMEVMPGHECQRCHILAPEASAKKATAKAVADAQDVIVNSEEINADIDNSVIVSENETVFENIVSDNETVSENTIIID